MAVIKVMRCLAQPQYSMAFENAVSADTKVEFDRLGSFPLDGTKADIGIAVVGEKPYAKDGEIQRTQF